MARTNLNTNLVGQRVKFASPAPAGGLAWEGTPAWPARSWGKTGEIRSAYLVGGIPVYTVSLDSDGTLIETTASNFQVVPE